MGKLHGTLAKAGKVRKQTPKVAKKEKRRKIQGRAYRRVQALKRGTPLKLGQKKRGPNCQTVKPAAPAKK